MEDPVPDRGGDDARPVPRPEQTQHQLGLPLALQRSGRSSGPLGPGTSFPPGFALVGLSHIPTSFVDRHPTTWGGGVQRNRVRSNLILLGPTRQTKHIPSVLLDYNSEVAAR